MPFKQIKRHKYIRSCSTNFNHDILIFVKKTQEVKKEKNEIYKLYKRSN